jgi:diaminopimelate epimerase
MVRYPEEYGKYPSAGIRVFIREGIELSARFTKLQGAGNDFTLVEAAGKEKDWPTLAQEMCRRHFGIGADGLLVLAPSKKVDFRMRVFNPDGSEAEACGNGLRCFVRYIIETGLCQQGTDELAIETMAGIRKARLIQECVGKTKIQVGMGKPQFAAEAIPVNLDPANAGELYIINKSAQCLISDYSLVKEGRELKLCFVSMGNPHAISFQEQPVSQFPIRQIGPEVENDRIFPRRTNFEVAKITGRGSMDVRVWERGAGETLACGSGACAVAVAARLLGYTPEGPVAINLPGGTLEIEWDGDGEVYLSGPAEVVFTGEWPE